MMKKGLIVLFMLIFSIPAYAYVNTSGSSGLLIIPTTALQPQGSFTLNYYNVGFTGSRINLIYGLFSHLELGVNFAIDADEQLVRPHIKGVLPMDEEDELELAIGTHSLDLYIVLGSNLGVEGFDGFLGYGAGDIGGFFFGISRTIEPIKFQGGSYEIPSRFVLEYGKEKLCIGLQFMLNEELGMGIGVQDLLGDDNKMVLGLHFSTFF